MFFKGYIETRNKQAIEKFKGRDGELKTLKQVQGLSEYAGILASGVILVDIDDEETSDLLYNIVNELKLCCRVYKTSRGKHFLFKNTAVKNNKTKCSLAIGLEADIKIGEKNSYEVLKYNDKAREIIYDTTENEEAQEIPRWLFPLKNKLSVKFWQLEDGDGRNQSLFNYILTLQDNSFTIEEIRETIRIINHYIMTDPLPESEIETILRDEAFQKPSFFGGKDNRTFLFDKFATFLKLNDHVLKINNQLHIYRDGIYCKGKANIEAAMIKYIPQLNRARRTEVYEYLNVFIQDNVQQNTEWIAFRNGLYNIFDETFTEYSPEIVITNKIDWNYNPSAYSQLMDDVLNRISCNDKEIRILLEQMIGYCFYRRNELRKAFILTGDGSNGKSTFIAVIQSLLGEDNISALDLKELGDRFKTAELFGKLANLGDDIGDEFIPNAAIFKKLVTGERVSVEQKGRDPFEFNSFAKLIFSANEIPRIKDKTGAVLDRLVIVPFNAKFNVSKSGYKQNIKQDLVNNAEAMEYLINLGLAGLKNILQNQKFSGSSKVEGEIENYRERNNPVLGFLHECEDEDYDIIEKVTSEVYRRYQIYCSKNNFQPVSNIEFSKQINRLKGTKVIDRFVNKKKFRIFIYDR